MIKRFALALVFTIAVTVGYVSESLACARIQATCNYTVDPQGMICDNDGCSTAYCQPGGACCYFESGKCDDRPGYTYSQICGGICGN